MPPATLATLKNHLAAAASDGPSLTMTKSIIRAIVDEFEASQGSDQAMTPSLALERIRDDLPPSTLFHSDCLQYPPLYRTLRDILLRLGINIESESDNQRLSLKVALTVYAAVPSDLALAKSKQLFHDKVEAGPVGDDEQVESTAQSVGPGTSHADPRTAHNVSMRMKDYQYSGAMTESLIETIHLYSRVSMDYDLNPASRLKLFHNAFRGEALRFYDSKVASSCSTFVEATLRMTEQFNSKTRQAKAKATLNQLRLDQIRADKGISTLDALEKVREQISILSPQCPAGFSSDAHQADALLNAVLGEPWASETLKRHGANPASFQSLFQALESALVFDMAEKESAAPSILFGEKSVGTRTNFSALSPSQDRYAIPRNPLSKSSLGKSASGNRSNRAGNSSCFGCGKTDHWLKDCP
jgi:hypothetical protein